MDEEEEQEEEKPQQKSTRASLPPPPTPKPAKDKIVGKQKESKLEYRIEWKN